MPYITAGGRQLANGGADGGVGGGRTQSGGCVPGPNASGVAWTCAYYHFPWGPSPQPWQGCERACCLDARVSEGRHGRFRYQGGPFKNGHILVAMACVAHSPTSTWDLLRRLGITVRCSQNAAGMMGLGPVFTFPHAQLTHCGQSIRVPLSWCPIAAHPAGMTGLGFQSVLRQAPVNTAFISCHIAIPVSLSCPTLQA